MNSIILPALLVLGMALALTGTSESWAHPNHAGTLIDNSVPDPTWLNQWPDNPLGHAMHTKTENGNTVTITAIVHKQGTYRWALTYMTGTGVINGKGTFDWPPADGADHVEIEIDNLRGGPFLFYMSQQGPRPSFEIFKFGPAGGAGDTIYHAPAITVTERTRDSVTFTLRFDQNGTHMVTVKPVGGQIDDSKTVTFVSSGPFDEATGTIGGFEADTTYELIATSADTFGTMDSKVRFTSEPDPVKTVDDAALTVQNMPIIIDVLANDIYNRGGPQMVPIVVDPPEHGTAEFISYGNFTYTPETDYTGEDSFVYEIRDLVSGDSYSATVTITVRAPDTNQNPVSNSTIVTEPDVTESNQDPVFDSTIVTEQSAIVGVPFALDVTATDPDVPAQTITYEILSHDAAGTPPAIDPATGTITWTPDANQTVSITVRASDDQTPAGTADITVTVTVTEPDITEPNQAPVPDSTMVAEPIANNDEATSNGIDTLHIHATANDEPDTARIVGLDFGELYTLLPDLGTITHSDTHIVYQPSTEDALIPDGTQITIRYTLNVPGGTEQSTADVTITFESDPIEAVDDAASIIQNIPITIDVMANDIYNRGGPQMVPIVVDPPEHGTVEFISYGNFTYTPETDYTGEDTFVYEIRDPVSGDSYSATVTITVRAHDTNQNPVSNSTIVTEPDVTEPNQDPVFDSIITEQSATVGEPFILDVTATDAPAQTITYEIVSHDATGTPPAIDPATGTITWTPDTIQTASITVRASDDFTPAGTADITVTVTAVELIANNDETTSNGVDTLYIHATANDEPDTARIVGLDFGELYTVSPDLGDIAHNDTHITYEPSPIDRLIPDGTQITIRYTLSVPGVTAQSAADVIITFESDRVSIEAVDDAESTARNIVGIDVLTNDIYDREGPPLALEIVDFPEHGTVFLMDINGTYIYIPDEGYTGTDTFAYKITDPVSGDSDNATVTIAVRVPNQNPVFDSTIVTEHSIPVRETFTLDVTATDADVPAQTITYEILSHNATYTATAINGWIDLSHDAAGTVPTIDPATGTISWIPDTVETVSITVRASDDQTPAGTADIIIMVTVTEPDITEQSATVGEPFILGMTTSDAPPQTVSYSIASHNATGAEPKITRNGTIYWIPDTAETVSITVRASDDFAGTDDIIITVTVTEPVVTEPVVTEPVVTEPVVTEPVVTEPVVTEPVVTEPNQDPVFDFIITEHRIILGEPFILGVTATDAPAQTITYEIVSHDAAGTPPAIDPATGTITWMPDANQTVSITVRASDDQTPAGTADITVTVTVSPEPATNTPPTARDFAVEAVPSETISVNLADAGHISDAEQAADTLVTDLVAIVTQGTADIQGAVFTYTADSNAAGSDTLRYITTDSGNLTGFATITVTIQPGEPMIATPNDDDIIMDQDVPAAEIVAMDDEATSNGVDTLHIHATANDAPADAFITSLDYGSLYTDLDEFGAISHNDTHIIYEPSQTDALIPDGFQIAIRYTLSIAGTAEQSQANVTITFKSDAVSIDAVDDAVSTVQNTTVSIDVLANDIYTGDPPVIPQVTGQPEHGTAELTDTRGVFRYTPETGYIGEDSFVYEIVDSSGEGDSATVTVTVKDPNPVVTATTTLRVERDPPVYLVTIHITPHFDGLLYGRILNADNSLLSTYVQRNVQDGIAYPATSYTALMPNAMYFYEFSRNADYTVADTVRGSFMTGDDPGGLPVMQPTAPDVTETVPEDSEAITITPAISDDGTVTITAITEPTLGTASHDNTTITYTPGADAHGTDTITYTVTDDDGASSSGTITITITPVNDLPVFDSTIVTEQRALAGEQFTLGVTATDPDAPAQTVSYQILSHDAAGAAPAIDPATGIISWTPDIIETVLIMVRASDNHTTPGTAGINITVTVSQASIEPALQALDIDVTTTPGKLEQVRPNIAEGSAITNATDQTKGDIINVSPQGPISYTSDANASGIDTVTYIVTDGQNSVTGTIYFHINDPENNTPMLEEIPVSIAQAQSQLSLQTEATDTDDDTITYAVRNAPDDVTISSDGLISWTPAESDVGDHIFAAIAHDDSGGFDSQDIAIIVGTDTGNHNPTAPDIQIAIGAGEPTAIIPDIRDQDGDDIYIISAAGQTKGQVVSDLIQFGIVAYDPDPGQMGTDTISYIVSDRRGGAATGTIYVHIEDPANTGPPELDVIGSIQLDAPGTATFAASASDPDGDDLTYVMSGAPEGATIDSATGEFSWTVSDAGDYSFTVIAYDDRGGFDIEPVAIVAGTPGSANSNPVAPDLDTAARQDSAKVVRLAPSDPDGNPTSIILATGASKGTIVSDSLQFGFILYEPDAGASGIDSITYYVSDGAGGLANGTAHVHIRQSGNNLPMLEPIGIQQADAQSELAFTATASDVDGDTLTYAIHNAPAGATIDSATGAFAWTPGTGDAGDHEFIVVVHDTAGTFTSESIIVTVTDPASSNQPPTAPDGSATTAGERTVVLLDISDPDGDDVTIIDATGAIQGLVDPEFLKDAIIAYTPFDGTSGVDTITYTVSDGRGGLATGTITITIS